MVRMKRTPKKPIFREPEVTEEMISNFKLRGRPPRDMKRARQKIKEQIREILLNEREEATRQRHKLRLEKLAAEAEMRRRQKEVALESKRRRRNKLARLKREKIRQQDREHRAELDKERALRELIRDSGPETEDLSENQNSERSPTSVIINETGEVTVSTTDNARSSSTPEHLDSSLREEIEKEELAKAEMLEQACKIQRETLEQRWAEIVAGVRKHGQEKFISSLYEELATDRLRLINEELMEEKMRTKELFNKVSPFHAKKVLTLDLQLADPKMMSILEELNKSQEYRERRRQTALEMQRAIELYDMIEEDWELDARSMSRTVPCHPTETSCHRTSNLLEPKYWQYHMEKVNDMDDPDYNVLLARFGSKPYYRLIFSGRQTHNPIQTYEQLEKAAKAQSPEYEVARQKFLQILGFHVRNWYRTSPSDDRGVEVSRLHRDQWREYIAFMRIQCGGHRAEKCPPYRMQIVFHLLLGRVSFILNKRARIMSRGTHITVDPKSTYSINCIDRDQAAYFVFRISFVRNPESPAKFGDHFDLQDDS